MWETEDVESPKRSIRDSGYVDCWDTERSDSLSPPRHGRDDSFDSLDSFGSRSQQTPSPDVVLRGSSDGRGSDSESDLPHRKIPDMKKDDMSARRTSYGEPKSVVPFNQYLPNKSNQTAYIPAPLRKKKAEREEYRKSWSTATSPLGGERPFSKSHPETIEEEQSEAPAKSEEERLGKENAPVQADASLSTRDSSPSSPAHSANRAAGPRNDEKDPQELRKLRRLEQAGIKVMPAAQRYGSRTPCAASGSNNVVQHLQLSSITSSSSEIFSFRQNRVYETGDPTPDIILRKENPFILSYQRKDSGSEDEREERIPDLEKDDFAIRRAKLNQPKRTLPFSQYLLGPYTKKEQGKLEEEKKRKMKQDRASGNKATAKPMALYGEMPSMQSWVDKTGAEDPAEDDSGQGEKLSEQRTQANPSQLDLSVLTKSSMTQADKETWDRLKVAGKNSDDELMDTQDTFLSSEMVAKAASCNDFASRKARTYKKATSPRQRFVHFGPVTEIDHQKWEKLSIASPATKDDLEEAANRERAGALETSCSGSHVESIGNDETLGPHVDASKITWPSKDAYTSSISDDCADSQKQTSSSLNEWHESSDEELDGSFPDIERDDMLARRLGTFQKCASPVRTPCPPISVAGYHSLKQHGHTALWKSSRKPESRSSPLTCVTQPFHGTPSPGSVSASLMYEDGHGKSKVHDEHKNDPRGDKMGIRNPGKDDMMVRRTVAFSKQTEPDVRRFLPVPFSKQQNGEETTKQLVKTEQKVKSIVMTDTVGTEVYPEICAEGPQRVALQSEDTPEQVRQSPPSVIREDVPSPASKDTFDPKVVQPGHLSSETKEALGEKPKEPTSLEDESTQM
ncbi:UNVERIFIED_CONTAM: hypothetical protein K2H54_056929 [Gekko kuhli]